MTPINLVRLRNVKPDDIPCLYEIQADPESNRMAVTTPRNAEDFATHWDSVLKEANVTHRTILLGDETVGFIACFPRDGLSYVGYRISRPHWCQGIATRAPELFLREFITRPKYARVATSNAASLTVLQKCGFVVEDIRMSPADDIHPQCEEARLILNCERTTDLPQRD